MADGTRKVLAYSVYLWIATAAVIAFNLAAALLPGQRLTFAALALTGILALAGIGFGVWAGLVLKDASKFRRASRR